MPSDRRPEDEGVQFVVADDDQGADEDLPQPDDGRTRARRLRVELGVGALALLVIFLVVRGGVNGSDEATPTPSSSQGSLATVAPQPTPTGPQIAPPLPINGKIAVPLSLTASPAVRLPSRTGNDPRACPHLHCVASGGVFGQAAAAIDAAFPEARIEQGETVRLLEAGHPIWFREVNARAGSELVQLRVQAPSRNDRNRSGTREQGGQRVTYYESMLHGWHVVVEVTDLTGGQPSLDALRSLAGDQRILR